MMGNKEKYYLGGYYLMRLKPKDYGPDSGSIIYSCSDCLNDNLVDTWSYSWTTDNDKSVKEAKEKFKLSDTQVSAIRTWVDNKHNDGRLGWINVFTDLNTVLEYRNGFFPHQDDLKVMALYFDETERADLINEFKPQSEEIGCIGLRRTLMNETEETGDDKFLGYDYIGIEIDGSFHTFHCHDIGSSLSAQFGLVLNEYGLFESDLNSKLVLDYLNDEKNGCEPVSWFVAKTKLIADK